MGEGIRIEISFKDSLNDWEVPGRYASGVERGSYRSQAV